MESTILSGKHPVWLSSGVLSQIEIDSLGQAVTELSVFNYEIDTSVQAELEGALDTIKEHHPDMNIWVQFENQI